MGKPPTRPNPTIKHFSHPHLLYLSSHELHQQPVLSVSCAACSLKPSGLVYTCIPCNYYLHIACSQLSTWVTHPCHQNHVLFLLSTPVYPGGIFNCDAWGNSDNGFSYHCGICNFDLHTTCASLPLTRTNQSHFHQLNLSCSLPNHYNGTFSCDICGNLGSKQWLYRCGACDFDAHLSCSMTNQAPVVQATRSLVQNLNSVPSNSYGNRGGSNVASVTRNRQNTILVSRVLGTLLTGSPQGGSSVQGLLGGGGGAGGDGGSSSNDGVDLTNSADMGSLFNGIDIGGLGEGSFDIGGLGVDIGGF